MIKKTFEKHERDACYSRNTVTTSRLPSLWRKGMIGFVGIYDTLLVDAEKGAKADIAHDNKGGIRETVGDIRVNQGPCRQSLRDRSMTAR